MKTAVIYLHIFSYFIDTTQPKPVICPNDESIFVYPGQKASLATPIYKTTPTDTPSSGSNAVKPNPGGDLATKRPSLILPNGESVLTTRKVTLATPTYIATPTATPPSGLNAIQPTPDASLNTPSTKNVESDCYFDEFDFSENEQDIGKLPIIQRVTKPYKESHSSANGKCSKFMTKLKSTESPTTPIATPIATPKSGRKRDIRTMLAYSGASWMQYIEAPRPELTGALTVRCKFCDNYTSRNKSHFFQHLCENHFFDELDEELRKHREVPFKCPVSECDFDNKNGSIFQLIKHYGVYHKFVQKYLVGQKAGYYVQYEAKVKGQLIPKCPFGVFKSTKKPTIFRKNFCPSLLRKIRALYTRSTLYHYIIG